MLNLINEANFFVVIIALLIVFFLLGFILASLLDRPKNTLTNNQTEIAEKPAVLNKQIDTIGQGAQTNMKQPNLNQPNMNQPNMNQPDYKQPQGHIGDQKNRYYNNYW